MKLWWWQLNNREKANRLFYIAPFTLIFLFLSDSTSFLTLNKWELSISAMMLIVIQGCYFKFKEKSGD